MQEEMNNAPKFLFSNSALNLATCTKKDIKEYFKNTYDLYEYLFTCIKDESGFYQRPDKLRLPLIFYYGHTTAFYINKLVLADMMLNEERINLALDTLMETGVDEMPWDQTSNTRITGTAVIWPCVQKLTNYRNDVKKLIYDVIDRTSLQLPITFESKWWSLIMAIEHERFHFETSAVLLRQLSIEFIQEPKYCNATELDGVKNRLKNIFLKIPGKKVNLGKDDKHTSFGWDNEYGSFEINVNDFEATAYLITNGDFLEFVQDSGYKNVNNWTAESLEWLHKTMICHPIFWICSKENCSMCKDQDCFDNSMKGPNSCLYYNNGSTYSSISNNFKYRSMFRITDLPLNWPVEVNYHEAKAYCKWKGPGYRLLSEAEFNLIMTENSNLDEDNWNINLNYWSSTPVNHYPPNKLGMHDTKGNVWQWTEDHFNGFPSFESHYLYDDYSYSYMDGKHNVILGGSWATTGSISSKYCRNFFRRHFFQFAGFRVVRFNPESSNWIESPIRQMNSYLSNQSLSNNAQEPVEITCIKMTTFNNQLVIENKEYFGILKKREICLNTDLIDIIFLLSNTYNLNRASALQVGCAFGNLSLKLTSFFKKVNYNSVNSSLKLTILFKKVN